MQTKTIRQTWRQALRGLQALISSGKHYCKHLRALTLHELKTLLKESKYIIICSKLDLTKKIPSSSN